jgi:hypothetical protein
MPRPSLQSRCGISACNPSRTQQRPNPSGGPRRCNPRKDDRAYIVRPRLWSSPAVVSSRSSPGHPQPARISKISMPAKPTRVNTKKESSFAKTEVSVLTPCWADRSSGAVCVAFSSFIFILSSERTLNHIPLQGQSQLDALKLSSVAINSTAAWQTGGGDFCTLQ